MRITDQGLLIDDSLVIGDLHLGIGGSMAREGMTFPLKTDLFARLESIIKKEKPKTVILNGDIKHEFGVISEEEWREAIRLIDMIRKYSGLLVIRGNHDTMLGPVLKKRGIRSCSQKVVRGYLVCHGHKKPIIKKGMKGVVVAHSHPALRLSRGNRTEYYKCFLVGEYQKKTLIIMPSFSDSSIGTDVRGLEFFGTDLGGFRIFVSLDRTYDFGRVSELP